MKDPYTLVVVYVCIAILLISITYVSYICRRSRSRPQPTLSFPFGTTLEDDADNRQLISFPRGLDDDVLLTFPTFLYAEVKTGDTATDANANGCSICLVDYKPADIVRLLPDCHHLFHVKCVDTWLKVYPTCPVCRNSPGIQTL